MTSSKKSVIVCVAILITSAVITFPRIWLDDWEKSISLGATLLGGFTGVFAIVISDKQINCVFTLLEELNGFRCQLIFYHHREIELAMYPTLRNTHMFDFQNGHGRSLDHVYVLFSPQNYFDGFQKVNEIITSPGIPVELLELLQQDLKCVLPTSLLGISEEEVTTSYKRHVKLTFSNVQAPQNTSWMELTRGKVTIGDFTSSLINLAAITKSWLEKHSDLKLN
jgi:hypothetical protein